MSVKSRREREKEQRKNQILDSARKLLFEKGLQATSVNQIAKNAELSVGLIYFYFKNKEEIYASLQEEGLNILYDKINSLADKSFSPEKNLTKIAEAYFDFTIEHKNYFDIINYFLTSPRILFPKKLKDKVDEHGNKILSILDNVIISGIEAKTFKEENPRQISILFWSSLHGFLQFKKLTETILNKENYKTLYFKSVKLFINGLQNFS